jgi:hypothetical protein
LSVAKRLVGSAADDASAAGAASKETVEDGDRPFIAEVGPSSECIWAPQPTAVNKHTNTATDECCNIDSKPPENFTLASVSVAGQIRNTEPHLVIHFEAGLFPRAGQILPGTNLTGQI